ncbi:MAG: Gfo/Idh/MocA family oxidoreductase [Saprospiraceae bacterium]
MNNRRKFIKQIGGATLATGLVHINTKASIPDKVNPPNTVNVGLIGCRGMGYADLSSFLKNEGTNCVALCDVDENILNARADDILKKTGKRPAIFTDYRKLLEVKEIQAVFIGTPDHWHCLIMVEACKAGKDIYVEKPIANSIYEANLMVTAANKYQRVVQVGQWQRSDAHWISALAYLNTGKLGKIRQVKAWADVNYGKGFDPKPDAEAPKGVHYDMWLGPAPSRPFNENRFHGSFRYFWDYAGGLMTDWGVHMLDMVLAGMNMTDPLSVAAIGGKMAFPNDAAETPDTLTTVYDFGNFSLVWEQFMAMGTSPYFSDQGLPGVAFIGENGILAINRELWKVIPQIDSGKYLTEAIPEVHARANGLDAHTKNFLECIQSRKVTNCTIEMGRNAALVAHLGNIAYRTGQKIEWDAKSQKIKNQKGGELIKPDYRSPWVLPMV